MAHVAAGPDGTYLDGKQWLPLISQRPTIGMELMDDEGNLTAATTSRGSISFRLSPIFENEVWSTYVWNNAPAKIWIGNYGDPFEAYTQIHDGAVSAIRREGMTASVELIGPEAALDVDFLTATYAGTGGAEGTKDMEGALKPWCSGYAKNVDPVVIDQAYWIFQVHGYGPVLDIPAVYERAEALDPARMKGSVATYGALAALPLNPSEWAVCLPLGLFRLGGAPSHKVTADVRGAKNGSTTPLTIDTIIPHLLQKAGVPANKIGDFSAFAGWTWDLYVEGQVTVGEIVRDALAQCGGVLAVDGSGVWFASDFYAYKNPIALTADRSSFPLVRPGTIKQLTVADPVGEVKVGYDRCWSVHDTEDVSPALDEKLTAVQDSNQQLVNTVADLNTRVDNVTGVDLYPIQERIDAVSEIGNRNLYANDKTARAYRDEAVSKIDSFVADWNENGESIVDSVEALTASNNQNKAAIQNEESLRISGDTSNAQQISLVGAKADQNAAAIVTTNNTIATDREAAATRMTEMETEVDGVKSGLVEEKDLRTSALEAEANARNIQISNFRGEVNAQFASESSTRSTQFTALAETTNQLSATLADANSRITQNNQAAIDRDASRASQINTVQSNLNGTNQALALVQQSANTSSNRLGVVEAAATLSVQAGNTIAGWKAIASSSGTSQLVFDAGAIAFRNPGTGGAEQLMEFRNGKMTVRSAAIGDASIGSLHVQDLSMGTNKLAFYSVIVPHAIQLNGIPRGRGVGVWYDVMSYDLYCEVDCDLFMWVTGAQSFPDGDKGYGIMLILDNQSLRAVGGSKTSDSPGLQRRVRVGAGWHQVKVAWHGHSSVSLQTCDLTILESKR